MAERKIDEHTSSPNDRARLASMAKKSDLELITERIVNLRVIVQSMLSETPPTPDEAVEASDVID